MFLTSEHQVLVASKMSSKSELDLKDDDENDNYGEMDDFSDSEETVLPQHIKESVSRLVAYFPFFTKTDITKLCQKYCEDTPDQVEVNTIVEDCAKELDRISAALNDSLGEVDSGQKEEIANLNPVDEVLKVFPNAKITYIVELLIKYNDVVNDVVQDMLEKGYARETRKEDPDHLDFTTTTWKTTRLYKLQAYAELRSNFPYLERKGLLGLFENHKHHYYPTYKEVLELTGCVATYNQTSGQINHIFTTEYMVELQDKCSGNPQLTITDVPMDLIMNIEPNLDETLSKELTWLRKQFATEREIEDKRVAEELNNELAAAEGSAVECGCCCCEYAFDNMRQCSEGHLFCKTCLSKYIEQTIFGDGRSVIKCMSTEGDVCPGYFSDEMIRLSLSEKVFTKYSEQLARDALKAAKLDNLKTCHHCQLQCEINEDVGIVMTCPNCYKTTCVQCGDEAHVPLKCSEVEKKGQTSKRLSVEEAMTQARVRQCPKCKTRFFKTEGCNKMTCTCGGLTCYVCRKDISMVGYRHFCEVFNCDHSTCNKCKLYSDSVEDDRLAMLEAGKKMLETAGPDEETGGSSSSSGEGPKIEVEKLLEGGDNDVWRRVPVRENAFDDIDDNVRVGAAFGYLRGRHIARAAIDNIDAAAAAADAANVDAIANAGVNVDANVDVNAVPRRARGNVVGANADAAAIEADAEEQRVIARANAVAAVRNIRRLQIVGAGAVPGGHRDREIEVDVRAAPAAAARRARGNVAGADGFVHRDIRGRRNLAVGVGGAARIARAARAGGGAGRAIPPRGPRRPANVAGGGAFAALALRGDNDRQRRVNSR